jgi:hypothetical protein
MAPLRVEKVKAVLYFLNGDSVFVRAMLEDKLFKVKECPFMIHFLSHLNEGVPSVLCCKLGAIRTLAMHDHIFDFKYLLKNRIRENLVSISDLVRSRSSPRRGTRQMYLFLYSKFNPKPL